MITRTRLVFFVNIKIIPLICQRNNVNLLRKGYYLYILINKIIYKLMFGSKKSTETANISPNSAAVNSLVKSTIVEGTVRAESDIRVDGVILGDLTCSAKVIIGPTGEIKGEVKCVSAIIDGKFEGKLTVEDLLTVRETASVVGDIRTGKLIVQAGAVFNVNCDMGKNTKKPGGKDPNQRIEQVLKAENVG